MVEVTQPPLTRYVIGVLLCSAGRARSDELKRNGATESVGLPLPAFGGERAGVRGRLVPREPRPSPHPSPRKYGERGQTEYVAPLITSRNAHCSGQPCRQGLLADEVG